MIAQNQIFRRWEFEVQLQQIFFCLKKTKKRWIRKKGSHYDVLYCNCHERSSYGDNFTLGACQLNWLNASRTLVVVIQPVYESKCDIVWWNPNNIAALWHLCDLFYSNWRSSVVVNIFVHSRLFYVEISKPIRSLSPLYEITIPAYRSFSCYVESI